MCVCVCRKLPQGCRVSSRQLTSAVCRCCADAPPADARILKLRAYEDNLAAYRDTVQVRPAQPCEG